MEKIIYKKLENVKYLVGECQVFFIFEYKIDKGMEM